MARGRILAAVALAASAALLLAASGTARDAREGGTFRVAVTTGIVDAIDPALTNIASESLLLDPTCATLMAYPDKPRPAGYRLTPSLAETEPIVSRDGRTWTFMIRKDARFSTGQPVTGHAFARALHRILDPRMKSPVVAPWLDVVGAQDVVDGKVTKARGIVATARTFALTFAKRPSDMPQRMTVLCAVPPALPSDPEGARAPLASPAPYFVSEYVPGERLVMARNPHYQGERPHDVTRFVANLGVDTGSAVDAVVDGRFDTVIGVNTLQPRSAELARRYGVNKSQYWVVAGFGLRVFHLNTSRPLFRKNPKLRQAVNFAVDRAALAREAGLYGETPTDQYLLPGSPGHKDERIYPLKGPDLAKAKALARGRTRGGKAVLYTSTQPVDMAQAQILKSNLEAIGIELEIKYPTNIFERLSTPGEPFDLGRVRWFPPAPDPTSLNFWFDGRTIGQPGSINFSHFNSPKINRLLDEASRLSGSARYRAYGELDVLISRDAAPMIPVSRVNGLSLVSARVGCVVVNPILDLTAVCLK
jgi:ABC-type transport system substrate-binding protein